MGSRAASMARQHAGQRSGPPRCCGAGRAPGGGFGSGAAMIAGCGDGAREGAFDACFCGEARESCRGTRQLARVCRCTLFCCSLLRAPRRTWCKSMPAFTAPQCRAQCRRVKQRSAPPQTRDTHPPSTQRARRTHARTCARRRPPAPPATRDARTDGCHLLRHSSLPSNRRGARAQAKRARQREAAQRPQVRRPLAPRSSGGVARRAECVGAECASARQRRPARAQPPRPSLRPQTLAPPQGPGPSPAPPRLTPEHCI